MEKKISENFVILDGDKVRIERGPQIVRHACSHENLKDDVTAAHYHLGTRDALGRLIDPEAALKKLHERARLDPGRAKEFIAAAAVVERAWKRDTQIGVPSVKIGDEMHCADWDEVQTKWVWKIYQRQQVDVTEAGVPVLRYIQVGSAPTKDAAIKDAKKFVKGAA